MVRNDVITFLWPISSNDADDGHISKCIATHKNNDERWFHGWSKIGSNLWLLNHVIVWFYIVNKKNVRNIEEPHSSHIVQIGPLKSWVRALS